MLFGVDWATKSDITSRKVIKSSLLNSPIVLLVEQVRSLKPNQMTKNLSHRFFSQDANNLIVIGKLIAYDIAFNNSTRFPVQGVWPDTAGSTSNFLFATEKIESDAQQNWDVEESTQFETLVAIDNQIFSI